MFSRTENFPPVARFSDSLIYNNIKGQILWEQLTFTPAINIVNDDNF